MGRTDQQYYADIQAVLRRNYEPGDVLRLVNQYTVAEPRKCEMCGDKVDIWNCYELQNQRSGKVITCGCNCIVKYAFVLERMNQQPRIEFPSQFAKHAAKVNRLRPNTVTLIPHDIEPYDPNPDLDDLDEEALRREELMGLGLDPDDPNYNEVTAEGLDPDDIDWDSCDYEQD